MSKGIYRRVHKQPYSDMPDHVETILMKLTREELRLSYNAVATPIWPLSAKSTATIMSRMRG